MNCNKAQPNLLDYSRGLLKPREASAIRVHLEGCPECRAVLETEIEFAQRLSASPKPMPQADVWLHVQSRIRHDSRRQSFFELLRTGFSRKIAVAAALFAVLVIAMFSIAPWNTPQPAKNRQAEQESIKQAVALLQVQPTSDNTDGGTTDAMMKVLDDEL
jgi:anti-sigma factor RsiW